MLRRDNKRFVIMKKSCYYFFFQRALTTIIPTNTLVPLINAIKIVLSPSKKLAFIYFTESFSKLKKIAFCFMLKALHFLT